MAGSARPRTPRSRKPKKKRRTMERRTRGPELTSWPIGQSGIWKPRPLPWTSYSPHSELETWESSSALPVPARHILSNTLPAVLRRGRLKLWRPLHVSRKGRVVIISAEDDEVSIHDRVYQGYASKFEPFGDDDDGHTKSL